MRGRACSLAGVCALWLTAAAWAEEEKPQEGQVQLPLNVFLEMQQAQKQNLPGQAAFTIGRAKVQVTVSAEPAGPARVTAEFTAQGVWGEGGMWPLLRTGVVLESAVASDETVFLFPFGEYLTYTATDPAPVNFSLSYLVPVNETAVGKAIDVPVPPAVSIEMDVRIPGTSLEVISLPGGSARLEQEEEQTVWHALLPRTDLVKVLWRAPGGGGPLVASANYEGKELGSVVIWQADFEVVLSFASCQSVELLSGQTALSAASVDGRPAVVEQREDKLAVRLSGAGNHRVRLTFETPIQQEEGPTSTSLWLPRPPISNFKLLLKGRKTVSTQPAAGVSYRQLAGSTVASWHLPPVEEAVLSWTEARPEAVAEAWRASALLVHRARAEEGLVEIDTLCQLNITRGTTHRLLFELPAGSAVNIVEGPGVADWRLEKHGDDQRLLIFLDREIQGTWQGRLVSERALRSGTAQLPLAQMEEVERQRSLVVLLDSGEMVLRPEKAENLSEVGENQIPNWARRGMVGSPAHTYKASEAKPELWVRLERREKEAARYDAVVDTLLSLGEGSLRATALVQLTVKSGTLMQLELRLPPGVNLLGVTAPALREHQLEAEPGGQRLQLFFRQEMEGNFSTEIGYELVMATSDARAAAPLLEVPGADTRQGRLAVEALSALEVRPVNDHGPSLQAIETEELPRQLRLRTANPILLAYKYSGSQPNLELEIKHHQAAEMQTASLQSAEYYTLVTKDGLVLTKAVYKVCNRSQQFLRLRLPPGSRLWSASQREGIIKAASGEEKELLLVPLKKSLTPYEIELVWGREIDPLRFAGWLDLNLPAPDILEVATTWSIFLPPGLGYGKPNTNLDTSSEDREMIAGGFDFGTWGDSTDTDGEIDEKLSAPLPVSVLTEGTRFSFRKIFSNRSPEPPRFSVRYAAASARFSGALLTLLAVALLGYVAARRTGLIVFGPRRALVLLGLLALGLLFFGWYLSAPLLVGALAALTAALALLVLAWRRRRAAI